MTEPKTEIAHITTPKAHYTLDLESGTLQVKPIITNADRIRAMTDEELAEFIWDAMNTICPNNCHEDPERLCTVCILDWLKEEANE